MVRVRDWLSSVPAKYLEWVQPSVKPALSVKKENRLLCLSQGLIFPLIPKQFSFPSTFVSAELL